MNEQETADPAAEEVTPTSDDGAQTPQAAAEVEQPRFERRWSKRSTTKPVGSGTTVPPVVGVDSEELAREKARSAELFDRLQRSMADLSNYRKRVEAEREEMAKLASMLLVAELLPVLDNFERALSTIPKELEMFSWLQGVMLIERHLRAILEREGVEAIAAVGTQFDPNLHEAVVEEESADAKPGTVLTELQRGYTMHGRVLRPTLAKVAKAPTELDQRKQAELAEEADYTESDLATHGNEDLGS
jgi:molecular chaperone GrpE